MATDDANMFAYSDAVNPIYNKDEKINATDLSDATANFTAPPLPTDLPSYEAYLDMAPTAPPPPPAYEMTSHDAAAWAMSVMISEEDALQALRKHAQSLCCWGEGPIDQMAVKSRTSSTAYKYSIDTWTESRTTSWKHEPYQGGPVDGQFNGVPPASWSIPVQKPPDFVDQIHEVRVPHTENVRCCQPCQGRGRTRCWSCHGMGHRDCHSCHHGQKSDGSRCHSCVNGRKMCNTCWGRGWVRCRCCHGAGQLKHFIELKVEFKTHNEQYVYETTDLPDDLILKAQGNQVFAEAADRIGPITNFSVAEINQNSSRLVTAHASNWPMERMWKQRQKLDSVPVFEIAYDYKGSDGRFWVYGEDKLAYSDDYPAQCCCCLNVPGLNNCACCNSCTIL